jgi:Nucleotidyl transferase AbiEii toxin, Type IV TA system
VAEPQREAPTNLRSLETRINNLATDRGQALRRIQRVVANTVVGQMLPDGVVKGGTAMKIRVGEAGSRFTPDFDALRSSNVTIEDYVEQLRDRLAEGWDGFRGTVRELEPAEPEDVPPEYVMQPFEIRLAYRGSHWLTVKFELGHDEVGSTENPDQRIAEDILELFSTLGLDAPDPIPVMSVEHQVAQKLHACTAVDPKTARNERAHDLVDLQILEQEETIDLAVLAELGQRLFAARRTHAWPPTVVQYEGWDTLYAAAAEDLEVIPDVGDAIEWANDLVHRAGRAPQQ